tara:strand:- start:2 stop:274 length:273 start_codon:yes stop_codon:yes gene_type:complete
VPKLLPESGWLFRDITSGKAGNMALVDEQWAAEQGGSILLVVCPGSSGRGGNGCRPSTHGRNIDTRSPPEQKDRISYSASHGAPDTYLRL